MKVSDMTFPYLWWQKSPWELQAFIPYSCDRDTCRYETLYQLHCQWGNLEDRVATEKKKHQKKSILEHCDDRRYLFDQGNEQTTGDIVEAAARPWCIYQFCPSQSPTIPFDTPVTGMSWSKEKRQDEGSLWRRTFSGAALEISYKTHYIWSWNISLKWILQKKLLDLYHVPMFGNVNHLNGIILSRILLALRWVAHSLMIRPPDWILVHLSAS